MPLQIMSKFTVLIITTFKLDMVVYYVVSVLTYATPFTKLITFDSD